MEQTQGQEFASTEARCFLDGLRLSGDEHLELPLSCRSSFVEPKRLYAFVGGDLPTLDVSFRYLTDPEDSRQIRVKLAAKDAFGNVVLARSIVSTDPRLDPQPARGRSSVVRRGGMDVPDSDLWARIESVEVVFTLVDDAGDVRCQ